MNDSTGCCAFKSVRSLYSDRELGASSGLAMQWWHAGIVERLRVSRAGQFSCPVLAGVVFLAHFDGDAVSSPQEVFDALQVQQCPCDTATRQSSAQWSSSLHAV